MKKINLVGQKFGRLTVIKESGKSKHGNYLWLCKCTCRKKVTICSASLRSGNSRSCGCLMTDKASKHGMYKTRFYRIWCNMCTRCINPNTLIYKNYGGRNIIIYKHWKKFTAFMDDMLDSYKQHCKEFGEKNTSIDRINNDGDYEPSNCRWTTRTKQANNKRNNVIIDYKGKKMTLRQWSNYLGLSYDCLRGRYHRGWSVEKILSTEKYNRS